MKLAIEAAMVTIGQTSPNPAVGAVVVKDGRLVGIGVHVKAGEPHAEVHAIAMAGEHTAGSTVYVTLEPCSHFGRTPPCSNLLIEKGVKRVVIACTDPNPLVSGKGIDLLKKAGIEVVFGVCEAEAKELNRGFFTSITKQRPYITLKAALSLDGKMSTALGDSKWITGEDARRKVHEERSQHDAILVGIGTILQDDPSLTVRLSHVAKQPIPVILDSKLRTPIEANVIKKHKGKVIIFVGSECQESEWAPYIEKGIQIIPTGTAKVSVNEVVKILGSRGIQSLYVEGGSTVHSSFIEQNLFDEMILYYAPKLIGGAHNGVFLNGYTISKMNEARTLQLKSLEQIGNDFRVVIRNEVVTCSLES